MSVCKLAKPLKVLFEVMFVIEFCDRFNVVKLLKPINVYSGIDVILFVFKSKVSKLVYVENVFGKMHLIDLSMRDIELACKLVKPQSIINEPKSRQVPLI